MKFSSMRYSLIRFCLMVLAIVLMGCDGVNKKDNSLFFQKEIDQNQTVKYANRFSISKHTNYTMLYLFGNRNSQDTTSTFVLYRDSIAPNNLPKATYTIRTPCKKIAALSSIYANMFCELRRITNLEAIDNIDYVNNLQLIIKHKNGALRELAKMPELDIEQTVVLNPDIVFTFGMGDGKDKNEKLDAAKIAVAVSIDHLEESPLARAEWIKFFAAFVNQSELADSIFRQVENNYFQLKELATKLKVKPSVFSEIKLGDTWYVPGGRSYMAQLMADASADYIWKDDEKFGSVPLSFEQVFAREKDADFWINLSSVTSKKELLEFESRYAEFKAYKLGNLCNNNKYTNDKGYSSYWETGMIFPNRILSDLIQIFHPELREELRTDFYYYRRLK